MITINPKLIGQGLGHSSPSRVKIMNMIVDGPSEHPLLRLAFLDQHVIMQVIKVLL
jgi:hypothetical protein